MLYVRSFGISTEASAPEVLSILRQRRLATRHQFCDVCDVSAQVTMDTEQL